MHYYQFNIGDYVSSTQHLDESEDIAYRRMLDVYYSKESPLPKCQKEIGRLIRMRTHSECIAIVLREFFLLEKDGYHCKRADKEILAFQEKSDRARKSAEARWSKNKDLGEKNKDANAMRTHSECNAKHKTLNTKHKTNNKELSELDVIKEDGFNHWWGVYPKKTAKPAALKAFKSKTKNMAKDGFMEFVDLISNDSQKRYKETEKQFIPNPSTYLNQERYNDE